MKDVELITALSNKVDMFPQKIVDTLSCIAHIPQGVENNKLVDIMGLANFGVIFVERERERERENEQASIIFVFKAHACTLFAKNKSFKQQNPVLYSEKIFSEYLLVTYIVHILYGIIVCMDSGGRFRRNPCCTHLQPSETIPVWFGRNKNFSKISRNVIAKPYFASLRCLLQPSINC
ncbi:MAG: hypothetical protein LBH80_04075 [Prevotellaceae bacterium]|jgi:hypothetical protein|nr:hypothetical protein [Prevotellaceae bacterium]